MSYHQLQRTWWSWLVTAFGEGSANNRRERAARFLEEALELAQACELDKPSGTRARRSAGWSAPC